MENEDRPQVPRRRYRSLSRHPLVSLVVGFVLTGLLGTFLSNYYSQKRAESDRLISEQRGYIKDSTKAIQDFSNLIYERHTWSMMLASSITRRAPMEELRERKQQYDRVFVKWNAAYQSNLLTIRKVMGASRFSTFEAYVDQGLARMFQEIDSCLTSAYDARIASDSPEQSLEILRKCGATKQLGPARDCSYEITSGLFDLVNSKKRDKELIEEVSQAINKKCEQHKNIGR